MFTHIDLFSGIGGFSLAAKWAGFRTIAFCEIDPFCQEVLKERFGVITESGQPRLEKRKSIKKNNDTEFKTIKRNPILIPDIQDFDGSHFQGATLLTGGFPCQPFSVAGKQMGKADNRYLWPEMLRVIAEARPSWVIGENVAGIVNMELEQVCLDLEGEGYEVQPVIIPACAKNAPHRRDRVWIIAHDPRGQKSGRISSIRREGMAEARETDRYAPDAEITELDGGRRTRARGERPPENAWDKPWPEVATRLCRVDDGISRRVDRLKSLGNSIIPQVAYEIMKGIMEIEREEKEL